MTQGKVFGYARVSTKEQNEGRQIEELKKYVQDEGNIIVDKASGKDFDRPQYQALKTLTREGDTIYIKSLDRLGRNKEAIKNELKDFKDKGVIIRVLNIPTTLMSFEGFGDMQKAVLDMVNNILIEVLGTMAEQERKTIRQRQREGIDLAQKQGKHLGRPKMEYPSNWEETYSQWQAKQITAKKAIEMLDMKRSTFYKLVKQYEQSK